MKSVCASANAANMIKIRLSLKSKELYNFLGKIIVFVGIIVCYTWKS